MATTAPAPEVRRTPAPTSRKRTMALWMAAALVIGNMIGSGMFLLPASLAGAARPISILGWVFTGAGAMLLALVFANLRRALPRSGGPYAYAKRAFGDFIGFQTAWGSAYRVTPELMAAAAPEAIFLHCLPAHRGEEVASDVIDGPQSAVWQQAANRLPTEQALLYALVTGGWEG